MVREVLQSVIESLRLRCADPVAKLTEALDANAMDPGICIPDLLFPLPTHKAELIAPAMICCEATLVGRAVLSPPRRVGDNAPYRYCVTIFHCRIYR